MNKLSKGDLSIILGIIATVGTIISTTIKVGEPISAIIVSIFSIILLVTFTLWRLRSNANRKEKLVDFSKHGIFSSMKYYYHQKIPKFVGTNRLRTKLIITALRIKFEVGYDKILEFVQPDVDQNINTAKQLITDMVYEYEKQWREEGVPEIFITKFYEYHTPKIEIMMEFIEDLDNDKIFDNNSKTEALLNQFRVMFDWTILDMGRLERELNGELTKALEDLHEKNLF